MCKMRAVSALISSYGGSGGRAATGFIFSNSSMEGACKTWRLPRFAAKASIFGTNGGAPIKVVQFTAFSKERKASSEFLGEGRNSYFVTMSDPSLGRFS